MEARQNTGVASKAIMLGGSFNPPTIAHLAMVEYLLNHTDKEIWIVPNGDIYHRKNLIPFHHRVNMLKLMFNKLMFNKLMFKAAERIKILDLENAQAFQGTYLTLRKLGHPAFVIGADSLKDLPTWLSFKSLMDENHFYVFPRGEKQRIGEIEAFINNHPILHEYRHHFTLIDAAIPDVSSTKFRDNFNSQIVTPEVYQYIIDNHLYEKE